MSPKKLILGIVTATVILFVWSGLSQLFPWGVPSANVINASTGVENFQAPDATSFEPGTLVTQLFEEEMVGQVNTLTTDTTFSWIVTKPISYYNPGRYFLFEFITQFLTAICLTVILSFIGPWELRKKLLFASILGLVIIIPTYGPFFNWWGLTPTYALGIMVNFLIGWLLACLALSLMLFRNVAP